jgi:hypothetical protein
MIDNDLLVCTTKILILLSNLFNSNKIDFEVLKSNSCKKLKFLESGLDRIEDLKDRELALSVINSYKSIFASNEKV